MLQLRTFMLACALLLGATSALHAQDALCPLVNRMSFVPINGAAAPNLLDGASYIVRLGRTNNFAGVPVLAALIMRNGACLTPMWVPDGAGQAGQLTTDTNLCLGGGGDQVSVMTTTTTIPFCGVNMSLNAFAYNGRRLATYGGGGSDILNGGSGKDHVFGGGGNDIVRGGSGSEDELYGESGQDTLVGSSGSATWSSGGTNDDAVVDTEGANDTLTGNSGGDGLSSGCNSSFLFCGSGIDSADSPDPAPPLTDCETWEEDLSC